MSTFAWMVLCLGVLLGAGVGGVVGYMAGRRPRKRWVA